MIHIELQRSSALSPLAIQLPKLNGSLCQNLTDRIIGVCGSQQTGFC